MNKTAIKNFAVWAREKLIADIKYKAGMIGINENGIAEPLPQSTNDLKFFDIGTKKYAEVSGNEIKQRKALVKAIKNKEKGLSSYAEAFNYIVEEVAYTWFNRLIAIRFMEVNEYLPSGIRVLSSENKAKKEPDLVTSPFDTDLEFTSYEQDRIIQLKDENKLDELFRMLFIKQCNKLHEILPELFEKTDDYSELLLSISFTDEDGIIYKLVHDIDKDDFNVEKEGPVEIIGWLYQFYNTQPKAEVFARKSGTKIKKEEIPAATQLFTPDWIVRYMVENSLGRLWVEGHPNDNLKSNWKYYLEEAEQEESVKTELDKIREEYRNLNPEDIKLIDPCMGSGHILIYAFDVLMQIYESYGYTQREAAKSILENNIYGVDIDKRAYQLSYFAIMMKARQYNRRILTKNIIPNLIFTENSGNVSNTALDRLGECKNIALQLLDDFRNVEEYGSLLNVSYSQDELDELVNKVNEIEEKKNISDLIELLEVDELQRILLPLIKQARILAEKYHITVTNPPYMPVSNGSAKLQDYVKTKYPDSKTDLFAVFIERCNEMLVKNGLQAMITMHSWMFLPSYETLREKLALTNLINMAHLGTKAFEEIGGEVVQTTSWVQRNTKLSDCKSIFINLTDYSSQVEKETAFLEKNVLYTAKRDKFNYIPGAPYSYWVSEKVLDLYRNACYLSNEFTFRRGISTGDNTRFLRLWYEVDINKSNINNEKNCKWYMYNKGGSFCKWYGNREYVVLWADNGAEMKAYKGSAVRNVRQQLRLCLSYSSVSTGKTSFRLYDDFLNDQAGNFLTQNEKSKVNFYYILSLLNSVVCERLIRVKNTTQNITADALDAIPVIRCDESLIDKIVKVTKAQIDLTKRYWDAFETSWDFVKHPLLNGNFIKSSFENLEKECDNRFNTLKANEEELNRIFIDIYGLQDELTPEVEEKDVTVRKADLQCDIKSFISYAVGCMFGRYSLDVDGLAYAGGDWDNSKYTLFIPDADNCIPITDEEYFEDDIVGRFVEFVKVVYGKDTLEENLDFIANALDVKGNTSREIIRNYFLNGFIKDHIKTYQKRPIYWLFDSGKQNGFKALVYMHRWNADTIGNMRVEYLHRMQRVYEKEVERMQEIIDNSPDSKEINAATKRKEKLQKQYKETKDYDAKVGHLALSRINIDLDDGVKVNYDKVQTANDGTKHQILVKI